MLSIPEIAAARWSPSARADGSVKEGVPVAVDAGAGDGVAGGFAVEDVFVEGAGAAGTDGVEVDGAGVDGSAGFGAALGFEVMHTMNPFSSILYDSTVLSSCKILPE